MSLERLPQESLMDHKYRILLDKSRGEIDISWKEINELLNLGLNPDTIRKGTFFLPEYSDYIKSKSDDNETIQDVYKYKETTEILGDGSQRSDKLISMSLEQSKDVNYLLEAHGFDKNEWELVSAKNNIWNANTKHDGIQTLFSSKISVKPKKNFDIKEYIDEIKKDVSPIHIQYSKDKGERLLTIPYFDMHWGIGDSEYYQPVLEETVEKIEYRKWDTITFFVGSDLFHNNDFKGKTANGTIIDKVDMQKAVKGAKEFYVTLINKAIENSNHVNVIFTSGNHDEMVGFMFVQVLEAMYPQVNFDTEMKERKVFTWNNIFLGVTHGDKAPLSRCVSAFLSEYGKKIAVANTVEILTGHLHSERTKDEYGIVYRTLGTGAKTDDWHYSKSFIGSNRAFQLFEYDTDKLKNIHYI